MNARLLAALCSVWLSGPVLALQPPAAPADLPPVVKPAPATTDQEILDALAMLTGSFKAEAAGEQPALTLHTAVINIEGLDNALYFEINRADTPQAAFSQGVFHFFRQTIDGKSELRLRVFTFERVGPGFGEAMVGLWLAPDAFPALTVSQLTPMIDVVLTRQGDRFAGSGGPAPINRAGATLLVSSFDLSRDSVRISDRGVKPDGSEGFGPAANQPAMNFTRFQPALQAVRHPGGLITYDLVAGEGIRADNGDAVAFQYTGWLRADGFRFDTSRQEGRQPLQFSLPGQLIQGWNVGVPGIQKGTVRRLVIPPGMGYGESGQPRARIPGNAWLVFEAECVYLKDNPPPPPPEPPAPVPPTGAPEK